jgi:proton-dependent oligopeptide transporter, POT family
MKKLFHNQPRTFYIIFMLEIWERFGFYTVQALLTLYFIRALHMPEIEAYYTFGAFSALVYSLVAFGGYLGDRILGSQRTLALGLMVLASGYLALALHPLINLYDALALIAIGNGLFKANPSNILSRCYAKDDPRLDHAYTLYYMAINLGAVLALLVGPALSSYYGYPFAYFASFLAISLALLNYQFQKKSLKHLQNAADKRRLKLPLVLLILIGLGLALHICHFLLQHVAITKKILMLIIICCFAIYMYFIRKEPPSARAPMFAALIMMIEAVLFFTLYQQLPTSLTLFAVHHIRHELWGINIDPQTFRVLNSLWVVTLSPLVVYVYAILEKKNKVIAIPYKFSIGLFFCGLGFLVLYFPRFYHDPQMMISPSWIVISYALQSLGELFVSALGISMVASLVPLHIRGFVMGMWFLTSAVAGFTGAFIASLTGVQQASTMHKAHSLFIYTKVFGEIGVCAIVLSVMLALIAPTLKKMIAR